MTTLQFESKAPHHTRWLAVSFPVDQRPDALLADLAAIGWRVGTSPAPVGNTQTLYVGKIGSGLFGGWTANELPDFLNEVTSVIVRHGFDAAVPYRRRTMSDSI